MSPGSPNLRSMATRASSPSRSRSSASARSSSASPKHRKQETYVPEFGSKAAAGFRAESDAVRDRSRHLRGLAGTGDCLRLGGAGRSARGEGSRAGGASRPHRPLPGAARPAGRRRVLDRPGRGGRQLGPAGRDHPVRLVLLRRPAALLRPRLADAAPPRTPRIGRTAGRGLVVGAVRCPGPGSHCQGPAAREPPRTGPAGGWFPRLHLVLPDRRPAHGLARRAGAGGAHRLRRPGHRGRPDERPEGAGERAARTVPPDAEAGDRVRGPAPCL